MLEHINLLADLPHHPAETVRFNESFAAAQEAVQQTLDEFHSLLDEVDEGERGKLLRSMGLKVRLCPQGQALNMEAVLGLMVTATPFIPCRWNNSKLSCRTLRACMNDKQQTHIVVVRVVVSEQPKNGKQDDRS